jgi:hypothetical protein
MQPPSVNAGHCPLQEHNDDNWQESQAHALPSRSHPFLHQIRIQNRERQPRDHSHNHDIEPELIEIDTAGRTEQGYGQQEHKHEELKGSLQRDRHRRPLASEFVGRASPVAATGRANAGADDAAGRPGVASFEARR